MKRAGVDAMLVTHETNVTYLTGFTGDSSYLLMLPRKELLLSDSRYTTQIAEQCPDVDAEIRTASSTMLQLVAKTTKSARCKKLAIESESVSKSLYDQICESVTTTELVPTSGWVEELRAVKDKSEIKLIRESVRIAQRAFQVAKAELTPEQTEAEIGHNLEHYIRRFGGQRCSFDPIVAVGPRAALPHAELTDQRIATSPFVLMDWGAQYEGYASDLTRVLVTGKISPKFERIYNLVLKAQLAAIDKIRPGADLKMVDATARRVIDRAGFGKNFGHGLGHGFGLQIHELPRLSPISDGKLKPGMVVTVEPGVYLPQWGGVRIEDDVLVTRDGHLVLSDLPKRLEDCVVELGG